MYANLKVSSNCLILQLILIPKVFICSTKSTSFWGHSKNVQKIRKRLDIKTLLFSLHKYNIAVKNQGPKMKCFFFLDSFKLSLRLNPIGIWPYGRIVVNCQDHNVVMLLTDEKSNFTLLDSLTFNELKDSFSYMVIFKSSISFVIMYLRCN